MVHKEVLVILPCYILDSLHDAVYPLVLHDPTLRSNVISPPGIHFHDLLHHALEYLVVSAFLLYTDLLSLYPLDEYLIHDVLDNRNIHRYNVVKSTDETTHTGLKWLLFLLNLGDVIPAHNI